MGVVPHAPVSPPEGYTSYIWKGSRPTVASETAVLEVAGFSDKQIGKVLNIVDVRLAHSTAVFTDFAARREPVIPIERLREIWELNPPGTPNAVLLRIKSSLLEALGFEAYWLKLSELHSVLGSAIVLLPDWLSLKDEAGN